MPSTVRVVNRLYTLLIGAVVIIATLIVAVFALVSSNQTGSCVNRVLGERARATEIEQDARYQATVTEVLYLKGRASKSMLVAKKEAYVRAQDAASAYRAKHPAGQC